MVITSLLRVTSSSVPTTSRHAQLKRTKLSTISTTTLLKLQTAPHRESIQLAMHLWAPTRPTWVQATWPISLLEFNLFLVAFGTIPSSGLYYYCEIPARCFGGNCDFSIDSCIQVRLLEMHRRYGSCQAGEVPRPALTSHGCANANAKTSV